jgi:hypothetical protein
VKYLLTIALFFSAAVCFAQQGSLYGGSMVLINGSNAVTIKLPGSPKTWTLTLPADTAHGLQYLYDNGTGQLNWGVPASDTSTGTVLYNTTGPQSLATGTDLFNIGYNTTDSGPALGALIKVVGNGGSNTHFVGLTDTARNIKSNNVVSGSISSIIDTTANSGSGTQIGLNVALSGSGTNYPFVSIGGNVGINTGIPAEQLSDSGNIRISGVNGLKITEGTNATMGTAILANVGGLAKVVVNTTKATATNTGVLTCRIFLTAQDNGGNNANVGMPYVTAVPNNGGSFTIQSTNNADRSTVAWLILTP